MPDISLAMIVKNEEAVLARCLDAAAGLYDELVIVDTGSSDRTVKIAAGYGARVLHYDWQAPGNKGAARNVGVDAATGDWIVVLDADEVLTCAAALRTALLSLPADITAANLLFENAPILRWYQLRAWRRGLYRYTYREHEYPIACGRTSAILQTGERCEVNIDALVQHLPPVERAPLKESPMLARLQLDVQEHPGEAHPLYFLHRQYGLVGEWHKSLELGQQYLDLPGDHIKNECHGNMARAYLALGDTRKAIDHLHRAVGEDPRYRAHWQSLSRLYADLGDRELAQVYAHTAEHLPAQYGWQWQPQETA